MINQVLVIAFFVAGLLGQYAKGKDWDVYELGVSAGASLVPVGVDVSISGGVGYSKCLNKVKKTSDRSWTDIALNHWQYNPLLNFR